MIRLGAFHVSEPVGTGATGVVWRGHHDGLPVAIKVLNAESVRDARVVSAFHHEIRAVARLVHPAVAMVLDVGDIPAEAAERSEGRMIAGTPWFALEWAGGGTLQQSRNQPGTWAELERLLRRLLDGLAHAHARGVVHRDLKLGNLLVGAPDDPRPGAKIADFGIAFSSELLVPAGYASAGTAHYMPPEQVRGDWREFGPWTDLYALGGVAWRLATGRPTFPNLTGAELLRAQVEDEAGPFVPRYPVPDGFEAWIRCCLRKAPKERFACAADADHALANLRGLAAGGVRPPFPASWRSRALPVPPLRLQRAGLSLIALRRPPFVGREAAFDRAWAALGRVVATGCPEALAVTGPAGVGRSRFAAAVGERAHEVGAARVITVDASRPGTLGRLVATATNTEGLPPSEASDPVSVVALLERLASADRPIVLVLDDVHGDPSAAAFVRELLARGAPPVLAILVSDAGALPGEPLPLGPLAPAEVERLLAHVLRTDARTSAILEERAAGFPDRVLQLLAHWVKRGFARDAVDEIPEALREPWHSAVEALLRHHPELQDDLEGVALAGGDLALGDWLRLGAPGRLRVGAARRRLDLIAQLLRRGLATEDAEISLAHPGLVEVVAERATREGRAAAWHRTWATRWHDADPARAGRQYLRAGDRTAAAERLEVAAKAATDARDFRAGLALRFALERVLGDAPDERWCALYDGIAGCAYGLDRRDLEREALEALRKRAETAGLRAWEARALHRIAHRAWLDRDATEARAGAEAARALFEALGDEGGTADALSVLAHVREATGEDPEGETRRQVLEISMRRGDLSRAADTLRFTGTRDAQLGRLERAEDALRRALALYPRAGPIGHGYASTCNGLGEALRAAGRADDAATWYAEALRVQRARGADTLLPALNLVICEVARGALAEARVALAACVEEARTSWDGEFDGVIHALAAVCAADAAEWEEFDVHVERAQAALFRSAHARQPDTADALERAAEIARSKRESARAGDAVAVAVWVREHLRTH